MGQHQVPTREGIDSASEHPAAQIPVFWTCCVASALPGKPLTAAGAAVQDSSSAGPQHSISCTIVVDGISTGTDDGRYARQQGTII